MVCLMLMVPSPTYLIFRELPSDVPPSDDAAGLRDLWTAGIVRTNLLVVDVTIGDVVFDAVLVVQCLTH